MASNAKPNDLFFCREKNLVDFKAAWGFCYTKGVSSPLWFMF